MLQNGCRTAENQSCKQQGTTKQWWLGWDMSAFVDITLGEAGRMKEGRMIENKYG